MGESIIELTLATRPFEKWMILDRSHTTGSDHKIIEWELELQNQEEAGSTQVVGWNLPAMSQENLEVADELGESGQRKGHTWEPRARGTRSRGRRSGARKHRARYLTPLVRKSQPAHTQRNGGMVRLRRRGVNLGERREEGADWQRQPRPRPSCRSQSGEHNTGYAMTI